MKIKVYNDGKLVFEGTAEQFLEENQEDEEVAEYLKELENKDTIEFSYFSGEWRIEKA